MLTVPVRVLLLYRRQARAPNYRHSHQFARVYSSTTIRSSQKLTRRLLCCTPLSRIPQSLPAPRCLNLIFNTYIASAFPEIASQRRYSTARIFPTSGFDLIDQSDLVEEESIPTYKPEKFYPVHIGGILNERYQVVGKLGYGSTSTVWLCRDLSAASRYVAVKVYITHANLNRELEIYKHLNSASSNHPGRKCVRMLLDSFEIAGPHGTHTCLVHRPLGKSLLELMKLLDGGVLNKDLLKPAMRQVLGALYYLHEEAGVIHTDLQPSNILLGIKDDSILSKYEENELKHPVPRKVTPDRTIYVSRPLPVSFGIPVLCDLGEARLESEKNDDDIMPDIYRAPEVILGMHWDNQVDIWNAGMLTWDLFQAFHLFHARDPGGKLHDAYHLASIASVLGPPPSEFLKKSENSLRYWDENGHWRGLVPIPEHRPLDMLDQRLTGDDKQGFVSFLKKMLCWAPEDRATAGDLLLDPWLIEGMFKSRPPSANN